MCKDYYIYHFHFVFTQDYIFGDAIKEQSVRKQTGLRRPEFLPLKDDVAKLREFMTSSIRSIIKCNTSPLDYVFLRNLVCCRLTLFNAR